jgi:hypothetical protein
MTLEKLINEFWKDWEAESNDYYTPELSKAILSWFKERMPKDKDSKNVRSGEYESVRDCLEKNKGANLYGANLSGADLYGANLSWANLYRADLSGANLSRAYLSGANLSGAYLSGAYLSGAYLSGANLSGANLSGANLSRAYLYGEKIDKIPMQICGLRWWINITKKHIQIGCEVHEAEEWFKFKDSRINLMDSNAVYWWAENKDFIKSAWEHHCK